jgi:putative ABC transport system permease protein
MLALISWIVPAAERDEWRAEWEGEWWSLLSAPGNPATMTPPMSGTVRHALTRRLDTWHVGQLPHELHHAWRHCQRRPAFTATVVAMLALGIGLNTALFTVIDSVLLRPLPYPDARALVVAMGTSAHGPPNGLSPLDLIDYRAHNHVFISLAGFQSSGVAILTGQGDATELAESDVTANYLATLGVSPFLGRGFVGSDEGRPDVVLLSYQLWHTRFNADASIVGRSITLDGAPTQVVGVMPPLLDRTLVAMVYRPFDFNSPHSSVRAYHTLGVIGRLRAGITLARAQVEMNTIAVGLEHSYPEDSTWRVQLSPYQVAVTGNVDHTLRLLATTGAVVLLIVCANIASLLLGRAVTRRREMAIRRSLGADRGNLVRMVFAECAVVSLLGGAGGIAIAIGLVRLVRTLQPAMLPRVHEVTIDGRMLVAALALSLASCLVFGMFPAWNSSRDLTPKRAWRHELRELVVGVQVALAVTLLLGASLTLRSLWRLEQVDPGFRSDGLLTARISLPQSRYAFAQLPATWTDLISRVRAIPGVTGATAATKLVMASFGGNAPYWKDGEPAPAEARKQAQTAAINVVWPDYFGVMGIRVLSGSVPDLQMPDRFGLVIDSSTAQRLYGASSAIGQRITWDFGTPATAPVLAVVANVASQALDQRAPNTIYFPAAQMKGFLGRMSLIVRTTGDPQRAAVPIARALAAIDPSLPLAQVRTMDAVVDGTTLVRRWVTGLLTAFAAIAALLALTGVLASLLFVAAARRHEFGIRSALGAAPGRLAVGIVTRGMIVVTIGTGAGLLVAWSGARLLRGWLFHITPADPVTLIAAPGLMLLGGLVASLVPARRAMRVQPVEAMSSGRE